VVEPIKGYVDDVQVNMGLKQLSDNLVSYSINARDQHGQVIDSSDQIVQLLENTQYRDMVPIVHQVLGSKTGI